MPVCVFCEGYERGVATCNHRDKLSSYLISFTCVRPVGHKGPHVCCTIGRCVVGVWGGTDEQRDAIKTFYNPQ